MAATRVWSSPYPFHCPSWTRSLRVTHELRGRQPQWLCSEFVPFLLLFDCQEAFHCCLVVTCINRINMISIQCHRVGEWWSGKPEFENVSDPAGVYIPFNPTKPQRIVYNAPLLCFDIHNATETLRSLLICPNIYIPWNQYPRNHGTIGERYKFNHESGPRNKLHIPV